MGGLLMPRLRGRAARVLPPSPVAGAAAASLDSRQRHVAIPLERAQ